MWHKRFLIFAVCSAAVWFLTGGANFSRANTTRSAAAQPQSDGIAIKRPLYYERLITKADLQSRSLRELTLMRNTIFARAGNPFRKKWLADYFGAQPWYRPLAATDESKVTALDKQNTEIIAKYDLSLSRSTLQFMLQQVMTSIRSQGLTPQGSTPEDKIELRLLSARLANGWALATRPKTNARRSRIPRFSINNSLSNN